MNWYNGINTVIKYGIWQPVKFKLPGSKWNDFLSYFWINVGNINIISFLIQFKNERLIEILQAVRCHILWLH